MDRYVGKVIYPNLYVESIVRWTHDGIVTRSHLSCRTPGRCVVSPVASQIIVAEAGSGALRRLEAVQERCRGRGSLRGLTFPVAFLIATTSHP